MFFVILIYLNEEVSEMAQRIKQTRPLVEEVEQASANLFTNLHQDLLPNRGLFQVRSTLEGTESTAKGRD